MLSEILEIQPISQLPREGTPLMNVMVIYKPVPHAPPAMCQVTVYPRLATTPMIILTEPLENKGMSVTNAVEYLVTAIFNHPRFRQVLNDDDPRNYLWIEHYPEIPGIRPATWDMVYPGWRQENGVWTAEGEEPRWYHLDLFDLPKPYTPTVHPESFF